MKTKAARRRLSGAERQKQAELDRKYSNPPTPENKRLRKIWWGLLIGAIAVLLFSASSPAIGFMVIWSSDALIIAALWLEFSKMKKVRRAYQEKMEAKKTKAQRAQERREKAEAKAAKAEAEKKYEEAKASEAEKKSKGVLGGLFGGKKKAAEAAEGDAAEAEAAKGASEK